MSPATELVTDELSNMISYSSILLSLGQEDENISKIENCLETSLVTTRQQGGGQHYPCQVDKIIYLKLSIMALIKTISETIRIIKNIIQ